MRPHIEMASLDLDSGWSPLPGFSGLEVKVLADDLDEAACTGGRSRLVRFAAGSRTSGVLVHPYWEEVFVLSGDMYALDNPAPSSQAPLYTIRPPGTSHGPFGSRAGCTLLEVQYFAK